MFLKHFDLVVNPFSMSSGLDFLFKSTTFEEGMAHLIYGLDNSEAIVLITGPIGSGKTMSLHSFLTNLGEQYLFALVTNTKVNHVELLKLILEDLDIDLEPGWDKSDLLIAFKRYLIQARKDGNKVVVVIDEAQNLSTDVLEEVRLLTNLGQGAEQPVQLILIGQPELKDLVNRPELEQLRQRIRVHYEFEKLTYKEMVGYIAHRMDVAGCSRHVFNDEALKKLYEISGGIPRLVNTHAGDALLSAFVAKRNKVIALDVEEGLYEAKTEHAESHEEISISQSPENEDKSEPKTRRLGFVLALIIVLVAVVWYTMFRGETLPTGADVSNTPVVEIQEHNEISLTASGSSGELQSDSTSVLAEVLADSSKAIALVPIIEKNHFYTHVASFRDSIRPHIYLEKFERRSFSGKIQAYDVNGERWYRLYLGPVATEELADAVGKNLQDSGDASYYKVVEFFEGSPESIKIEN